jgi:GMP synthase-like glutamine amidotransferase
MINTLTTVTSEVLEEIAAEQKLRQTHEVFLLFAMGSQFDHLIKLALEKLGVYCLVADSVQVNSGDVKRLSPTGIIVSGGPASVHS